MREIKFRAWDKTKKEMLNDEWCANNFTSLKNDIEWTGEEYENRDTAYCLMQYTGLKDSKGVEIYEGDIVKCEIGQDEKVEFKNGMFIGRYRATPLYNIWLNQEIEITGNIYEGESK